MTDVLVDPFDDLSLELLRLRHSAKWKKYPPDVLPAWVAETDFPLALPIREALLAAISRDDTGYAMPGKLPQVFAGFAARRFGWEVEPARVRLVVDTMSGVLELVRGLTAPGDGVVVNPPVYAPFFMATREAGRRIVHVPLVDGRLDLDGLERAFAAGARRVPALPPAQPDRPDPRARRARGRGRARRPLRRHGDLGRGARADDAPGSDPRPVPDRRRAGCA